MRPRSHISTLTSTILLLPSLLTNAHTVSAQGQPQPGLTCFAPDGITIADNETYVPCNKLGITQQNVHSSCCRLDGPVQYRDLCASTGLCINDGVVNRGYCTDPTWKSPACVGVCTDPKWGGSSTGIAEMTSCTDGSYCCGHNNLTCCGTKWAVKVPLLTTTSTTTTVTATPFPSARSNIAISAGLGGALGLVVLVSSGLIFYLLRHIRRLKEELGTKKGDSLERAHLASPGRGTGSGGFNSPQFGEVSLSPLPMTGGSTGVASTTNSTIPWTAHAAMGRGGSPGHGSGDPYGNLNFKGLYDPPVGNRVHAVTEMELSPPRSELDATGGMGLMVPVVRSPPSRDSGVVPGR